MADEFARDMLRLSNITMVPGVNPRVVAIVCAAYIEKHLTGLIRRKLPGLTPVITKSLFDEQRGHLGTIGAKIDIALALEAIEPHVGADARVVATVRNKFAHRLEVETFDDPAVRDLVDKLATGRDITMRTADGKLVSLYSLWERAERFRVAAIGVCSQIMYDHVEAFPYTYTDPTIPQTGGGRSPLHTISVPLHNPPPEGPPPEDQPR